MASPPLKYQTWVLKVHIHCEGCKRKVKKLLHSVYGVYTIEVDSKEQKVTVTGNVDSAVLIKKLEKSGKYVELISPPPSAATTTTATTATAAASNKAVTPQPQQKQPTNNNNQSQPNSNKKSQTDQSQSQTQKSVDSPPEKKNQKAPAVEEKKPPESNAVNGGGKKKKKKGNNGNGNGGGGNEVSPAPQGSNGGEANTESQPSKVCPPAVGPTPVNESVPRHQMGYNRVYDYPQGYCVPQPVYGVSYNTAYPTSSYTASYYYKAPTPYSYVRYGGGTDVEQRGPLDWNSYSQPRPLDFFSDENPNACSVM